MVFTTGKILCKILGLDNGFPQPDGMQTIVTGGKGGGFFCGIQAPLPKKAQAGFCGTEDTGETADSLNTVRDPDTEKHLEKFLKKGVDFVCEGRYNMELYENNEKGVSTMPNIKSSKKDVLSSKIAYEKNKANKSELKTNLKKFDAALESGDKTVAEAAYKTAIKAVDQAVVKGLLHKNNAARKKSSMTLKLNKLA